VNGFNSSSEFQLKPTTHQFTRITDEIHVFNRFMVTKNPHLTVNFNCNHHGTIIPMHGTCNSL